MKLRLLIILTCALAATASGAENVPESWTMTALDGSIVAVPDESRTTVLVFAMNGQSRSADIAAEVRRLVGVADDVQATLVVSGADARLHAEEMTRKVEWTGKVVADPDYHASARMKVRAWPTTVVINHAGRPIAHLAGVPSTFEKDLQAYLAFARGKIDQAQLDEQLVTHGLVASTPEQIAQRHLQVAVRLMDLRQIEQARTELEIALKDQPDHPELLLALARLKLMSSQPEEALGVLEGLADKAAAWRVDALRGRAFVALRRWDEARTALTQALKLNPAPAETLYFLGRVEQRQGHNDKAAAHFRTAFEHSCAAAGLATDELTDKADQ